MADMQDTSQNITDSFIKGLNKDSDPSYVTDGMWTHAVNMVNNSKTGKVGSISNESSNYLCFEAGKYMPTSVTEKLVIGAIYLFSDKWVIFTAGHNSFGQPINSEIGLFEEENCTYKPIVIDSCLNFDKRYLISGVSRLKEDCTWQIYWVDGLNPDRYLNIGDPQTWPGTEYSYMASVGANSNYYEGPGGTKILWPNVQWTEECKDEAGIIVPKAGYTPIGCITCTKINNLNCDDIRLARLMKTPCLNLTRGQQGGTLANGTYFALIAYTIKGQKVTDYFAQSNYQFIYSPQDLQGSLTLNISADNDNFDEFQLVIVKCVNQQTVAQLMGIYSTNTSSISIDQIDNGGNITIPLEQLPLQTPVYETSDQMAEVNNYLLRVGPRSKFDFNYQPLANLIKTKWASVEYPADYYMKGGNKTNYMRDEVYSFFIRWVYNTGDKTSTYHIPGRPPRDFAVPNGTTLKENLPLTGNQNTLYSDDKVFEVYNTATIDNAATIVGTKTDDGGEVIATGDMGYWESTEKYPDNRPDIWNPSAHCWTGETSTNYDLCAKYIRHHKFPEDYAAGSAADTVTHFRRNTNPQNNSNDYFIRLMGVYFENITLPKDNNGDDIPGIVGYEILRGSREGNKTIVAKGLVNNFRTYQLPGSGNLSATGLYPNYPFNTIQPLSNTLGTNVAGYNDPFIKAGISSLYNQAVPEDIFSFHSPDTMMTTPFLSTTEFKTYGPLSGYSVQNFNTPTDHPKFKLLSDVVIIPLVLAGVIEAIISAIGKKTDVTQGPGYQDIHIPDVTGKEIRGNAINGTPIAGGASGQANNNGGIAIVAGVTNGTLAMVENVVYTPLTGGSISGGDISGGDIETADKQVSEPAIFNGIVTGLNNAKTLYNTSGGTIVDAIAGGGGYEALYTTAAKTNISTKGSVYTSQAVHTDWSRSSYLPTALGVFANAGSLAYYFSEGVRVMLNIIYAVTSYKQFALQQKAYGFYSNMDKNLAADTTRFKMEDGFYLRDNIQSVSRYQDSTGAYKSYNINNLKRSPKVVIRTKNGANENKGPKLLTGDKSLTTLGTLLQAQSSFASVLPPGTNLPDFKSDVNRAFSLPIQSHYGAIRGRVRNQYGQLDSIKQLPVGTCEQKIANTTVNPSTVVCNGINKTKNTIYRSPLMFGGDTYINRYTEKDTMCFFYDWLYDQPDGFEYNYFLRSMIPNPRFRLNSTLYDSSDLASIFTNLSGLIAGVTTAQGTGYKPSQFYNLDYYVDSGQKYNYGNDTAANYPGFFVCKDSYFYLAVSSIKDFFVESEVLVDFRTQPEEIAKKYYNPYNFTDYNAMFDTNPNILGVNSTNQYDYSLSVSKLYNQYFSLGTVQNRYYDPNVADLCYTYYPNRIIYSLPQQDEAIKDSWFVYLVNNYKAFKSQVSGVKSINKSGIVITFKNDSPVMYQGVDTLQTELGTKVTLGDGGLFSQAPQQLTNADKAYEYGASQNRLSVISTPVGMFYMSQAAGKVFSVGEGLQEISQQGMKWWFTLFLPYKLLVDFPLYPYIDNPVAGIGCQSVFDNTNTILYFCKKDYQLKDQYKGKVSYVPLKGNGTGDYFMIDGNISAKFKLGDPILFRDASWTVSYDPKNQFWISFHDWHPDLLLPTKDVFISTKGNGGWRHNWICDSYCNYYGLDYACEIDIPIVTGQSVTTTRSIEYILEAYRKTDNCVDSHHVLDYNFDTAVVYNSEQVSGYLNLNIYPKNDLPLTRQFPRINPITLTSFDILFTKEENKYRFSQFWDITKDRGEFPIGSPYPADPGPYVSGTTTLLGNYANLNTWVTEPDGFRRVLNQNNLDYLKPEFQRKKFRHYMSFVNFKKNISGNTNIILKINNSKNEISLR
jgi:hypothetical protein